MTDKPLFNEKELAEIEAQALAEVEKELKAEQRKKLLAEARKAARRKMVPAEKTEIVMIDLPPFAQHVMLDGVRYFHGRPAELTKSQADSVRDIISNAWNHEEAAFGNINPNAYRREQNRHVRPGMTFSESGHFSGGQFVSA